jgi:hypothetical protein
MVLIGYANTEFGYFVCVDCATDEEKQLTPVYDITEGEFECFCCNQKLNRPLSTPKNSDGLDSETEVVES